MRRTRSAAAVAAVSVLCLAGPSWPAAAQPVLPPPVNPGERPSAAEAETTPYQAPGQVGSPVAADCIGPGPEGDLDLAAIPPGQ